jgi:dienelactone hydrolase
MNFLIVLLLLLFSATASAEMIKIPWNGDYAHNSNKTWTRDNPYDSGFSKNFLNGTPEEGGKVQKDGEIWIETVVPAGNTGPIPFMVVMHGCMGMSSLTSAWSHHVAKTLNAEGIGVLILDSYTTRKVEKSCGMPDFHWGRRRADDAYSALNYLIENKLANPDAVYLMGQSNGGLATLVALSKQMTDHKYQFAAGFPVVPSCINTSVKYGDYYNPMIIFAGDKDDANPAKHCVEMLKKKRSTSVQLIIYKDANHGFMEDYKPRTVYGWTDSHGKVYNWTLSYNSTAEKDMMETIIMSIKTKKFVKGVVSR